MLITVLEAHVAPGQAAELERAFQEATSALPPQIVESFLVRDSRDGTLYQIITVWTSAEALGEYRASVEEPKGVQMFEAVGATPNLSVLDVIVHGGR